MRIDGRDASMIRPVQMVKGFMPYAEGSVLIEMGNTRVICTASIVKGVPPFLKDTGKGWLTAEYAMLPRSTTTRTRREGVDGKSGRTYEIQRLIGRSMRAVTNLEVLGEITIWMDCDVIQADGGTRTASITGAFVALREAFNFALQKNLITQDPLKDFVAAISVGIVNGEPLLDLNYAEDSVAEVDMNVVMTGKEKYVEIQGTAETRPFDKKQYEQMLYLAQKGIHQLIDIQGQIIEGTYSN
jgi:ribonuclease PH